MKAAELKELQTPIKARYRDDPGCHHVVHRFGNQVVSPVELQGGVHEVGRTEQVHGFEMLRVAAQIADVDLAVFGERIQRHRAYRGRHAA